MPRARLLLLIVIWEGSFCQMVTTEYMNSTDGVKVQRELCVIIPCKFDFPSTVTLGDNPHRYWFKDKAIIRTDKPVSTNDICKEESENARDCFHLLEGLEKHNCTLRINDANGEHDGRYFFRTEGEFLNIFFKIRPFVNEIDLSEQAKNSRPAMPAAKVPVNIACTAPGRCTGTAPIITWAGTLNKSNYTANASSANENRTVLYESSITFTPSLRDRNTTLTCVVYHPVVEASIQATASLNVAYRSESGDQLESNCSEVYGGVWCTCSLYSDPPPVLQWLVNSEIISGNYYNSTVQLSSGASGLMANSTLNLLKKKFETIRIHCWNANKQTDTTKKISWWLDFRLLLGIILANLVLASLISLAAFYCGRKVQEKEKELDDLETTTQGDTSYPDSASSVPSTHSVQDTDSAHFTPSIVSSD